MSKEWTRQCPATDSHDAEHAPYIPDDYEVCDRCLLVRNNCVEERITVGELRIYGYVPAPRVAQAFRSQSGAPTTAG